MQRLGKNLGRYYGEPIDIDAVLLQIHQLALAAGWASETFLDLPNIQLRAYQRLSEASRINLYVATGIHGDEPAGPLTVMELLKENAWPDVNIWLVPCTNPTGFRLNTRENDEGIDLNRDYRAPRAREVKAHREWLERQPQFDITVLLHEDWEAGGFYVYELNPHGKPSLAEPIIDAVRQLCPIETSELVDDFTCKGGIIRPVVNPSDRPQWAEAVYLIARKSQQSYTLETPSDFPLRFRVQAHVAAVHEVFRRLSSGPASNNE